MRTFLKRVVESGLSGLALVPIATLFTAHAQRSDGAGVVLALTGALSVLHLALSYSFRKIVSYTHADIVIGEGRWFGLRRDTVIILLVWLPVLTIFVLDNPPYRPRSRF
ncbi:MAG TPA: hypothetical protein VIL69_21360 [Roseomonas sp.]|jgi:hypothetical protein